MDHAFVHSPGARALPVRAYSLLALVSVALACRQSNEERQAELGREIAVLAPRVAPLRERILGVAASLPASASSGPVLGPLEPRVVLEYESGRNAEVLAVDDLDGSGFSGSTATGFGWEQHGRRGVFECLDEFDPAQPDRVDFYDAARLRRACESALALEYLVVVRAASYRPPAFAEDGAFTSGLAALDVFVVRLDTGEIAGAFPVYAVSSWEVDYRFDRESASAERIDRAELALIDDLDERARKAVYGALGRMGAVVDVPEGAPSTVLATVSPGWQIGSAGPVSFSVPGEWARATTTTEFMLARWQRPAGIGSLPTFYLEWRRNDAGTFEQLGPALASSLRQSGSTIVEQNSARDAAGRPWIETETVLAVADRAPVRNWLRAALTRDGRSAYLASCGGPDTGAELARDCQSILATLVAHD